MNYVTPMSLVHLLTVIDRTPHPTSPDTHSITPPSHTASPSPESASYSTFTTSILEPASLLKPSPERVTVRGVVSNHVQRFESLLSTGTPPKKDQSTLPRQVTRSQSSVHVNIRPPQNSPSFRIGENAQPRKEGRRSSVQCKPDWSRDGQRRTA